jgi:hypothetical protein
MASGHEGWGRRPVIDFDFLDWDDANTDYIAEHAVTPEEFLDALEDPNGEDEASRSSGRRAKRGRARTGKSLFIIFEVHREHGYTIIRPVNAYEIESEPEPPGW